MQNGRQQQQIMLPKGVTIRSPAGGGYVVEGLLGTGGVGAVYLVRDRQAREKLFALKEVIDPDKRDRERFVFEGEVLERLHHQALPRVYSVFEHSKLKRVYILMDYIQGKNLELLRQEQPEWRFSLPLVLALMAPIVDALIYLHHQESPIVHRDIKPANIIVPVGADEAVLVDFGSAKEYVANETTTINHRTPGYAAPEQYGSGTTPRTDIYGLGATFYTLLTGTVPIDAVSRVIKNKNKGVDHLMLANVLEPTIPPEVAQALQRALSINSADRFETVEEFWQVLNTHATTEQQVQIPRVTSADTPQPLPEAPRSRKQAVLIPLYLLVLLIVALSIGFLFNVWYISLLFLCVGIFPLAAFLLTQRQ